MISSVAVVSTKELDGRHKYDSAEPIALFLGPFNDRWNYNISEDRFPFRMPNHL